MVSPGAFAEGSPRAVCGMQCGQMLGDCLDTFRQNLIASFRPCHLKARAGISLKQAWRRRYPWGARCPWIEEIGFPGVRVPEN